MRKSTLLVGLVVGALLIPVAVFASHSFNDVRMTTHSTTPSPG